MHNDLTAWGTGSATLAHSERHKVLRNTYWLLALSLLPTEYKLLEFLMRNTGQILSRMMIFEEVWGYHFDPGTNLIDVHIGRLRKKIDPPGNVPLIRTVRGSGYVIAEPV